MTTQHTPVPWNSFATGPSHNRQRVIYPSGQNVDIAVVYDNDGDAEANAAFIIRACNAHDDLLDALEKANGELIAAYGAAGLDLPHARKLANEICGAAIAKAQG